MDVGVVLNTKSRWQEPPRRHIKLVLIWSVCLICLLFASSARPAPLAVEFDELGYAYQRWTSAEGLPQNTINAIIQTRDGYLWLATYGGLTRFNGSEFKVFDQATNEGLLSNRIVSLYEDPEGVLWIGHEYEGVNAYADGKFRAFTPKDGMPSGSVQAILKDASGTIWVGTEEGLGRWRDGRWTRFDGFDGLPVEDVRALSTDREGGVWVGTARGLARYVEGRFEQLMADDGIPPGGVHSFFEDAEGLWIGVTEGLVQYSEGVFENRLMAGDLPQRPYSSRSLARGLDRTLWAVSAPPDHFFRFREVLPGEPGRATWRREIVKLPQSFKAWSTFVDREGSLWVGTIGDGLLRLRHQPIRRYTTEDGLPAAEPRVVAADGEGGLWIGFGCAGPGLIRFAGGLAEDFATAVTEGLPVCASALLLDRRGVLWIGGSDADGARLTRFEDGAELMSYEDGVLKRRVHADSLPGRNIQALLEDRDGGLWVGTAGAGIVHLPPGEPAVTYTTREGLVHDHVHFLLQDRAGAVWIGTNTGLSRLENGLLTNITADDGLSPGMVRAIYQDGDDMLWIGTYGGGLSRIAAGEIFRYTIADGLFDNVVSTILEDQRGRLWMLGNSGLFYAGREDLNAVAEGQAEMVFSVSFATAEGMVEGTGGSQPAGSRTEDGRLWFPTIDGLATIDAQNFRIDEEPPPVVIERLAINGKSVPPAAHFEVAPGNRDLEIHYAGLSFLAPERLRYRYLLEGYETDWVEVGDRRLAHYTNLPPGQYTFRVSVANHHGVWNESGASISFVLVPFFWETSWFYAVCSAFLVSAGYFAYRIRMRSVEERNRLLREELMVRRQLQAEREQLIGTLEAQKAELERFNYTVSHDLKSPLVTIKGFIGMLENDQAKGREERLAHNIARISNAADKMARILDELLEFSRIGHMQNRLEKIPLTALVREAVDLVGGRVNQRGVAIRIEEEMPTVVGDRVRLLEVFENLLDNAAKFMGDTPEPHIEVGVAAHNGQRLCYVRDNGQGIDPRYHQKIFDIFERLDAVTEGTGIGLALVKRIIEAYGGRIWVDSEGLGRGSTFWFTLPSEKESALATN